jgi:HEAT repeat protein
LGLLSILMKFLLKGNAVFPYRRPFEALICALLAVVAVACSKVPSTAEHTVVVLGVDDRASGVPQGLRFDPQRSEKHLSQALSDSKSMQLVEERSADAYRAELEIALATERESDREGELGVYRAVQVELRLKRRVGDETQRMSALAEAFLVQEAGSADRNEGFDRVLELAVGKAVDLIDLQFEIRKMSPEQLKTRLISKRAKDRLYVLRSLRERELPELLPAIIACLRDSDDEVVLEAVGVLVAQKDLQAVVPLIRMSQTRDPVFQLQLITAVAELGGPVARGYLFTLAAGHGSSEIRRRANEGLDRIQAAGERAGSESSNPAVAMPRRNEPDKDAAQ